MKLKTYLSDERMTLEEFGKQMGCTHAAVSRWINGTRKPSINTAMRIEATTGGAVRLSDWRDDDAPAKQGAA